jgi:hypothetical protein
LFINEGDYQTVGSVQVQRRVDKNASPSDRCFGHIAIVISDILAIEAVPSSPPAKEHKLFQIPHAVEFGRWSRAELRGGVRLTPIADIVVPAMTAADFVALRHPKATNKSPSKLEPTGEFVVNRLGSRYSVDDLKTRAVAAYSDGLLNLLPATFVQTLAERLAAKSNGSSSPTDFATRIALEEELREKIASTLPSYVLPEAARSYYCSQLAVEFLLELSWLESDPALDTATPTGLFHLLLQQWHDVTDLYRCAPDPVKYLHRTPTEHAASYTHTLSLTEMAMNSAALELQTGFIKAVLDQMNASLESIMKRPSISNSLTNTRSNRTEPRDGN